MITSTVSWFTFSDISILTSPRLMAASLLSVLYIFFKNNKFNINLVKNKRFILKISEIGKIQCE